MLPTMIGNTVSQERRRIMYTYIVAQSPNSDLCVVPGISVYSRSLRSAGALETGHMCTTGSVLVQDYRLLHSRYFRPNWCDLRGELINLDQCRDQRFKMLPIAWRVPVGTAIDVEGICQKGPSGTRGKLSLARKKGYWL